MEGEAFDRKAAYGASGHSETGATSRTNELSARGGRFTALSAQNRYTKLTVIEIEI